MNIYGYQKSYLKFKSNYLYVIFSVGSLELVCGNAADIEICSMYLYYTIYYVYACGKLSEN